MAEPERCGNCGQWCGVKYEWRGASYTEVIDCENCGPAAFKYDPLVKFIENASDEEVREFATGSVE